ncbi:hypothetical protein NTGBS_920019 [Candidatus Nitrotoga sp. BS]|uniref:hypothetical protein n=1 Tax=Candidatus Nitrotoga sp. BS TaxID=2890408 RepID=UPI001EF2EDDF|nr:hypothetical protein [Candidatus Nitrotoga sp. BS]CAH1211861.1 hypothetical protein NTGBS_920019 [Candidatus Nitrotoga sp. BS]
MATIEFRINIIDLPDQNGSGTVIPHSFIIINNGAGFVQGYGFAPATPGDPMGPGHIYPDTDHPYDFSSGPIQISDAQYNNIASFINASIQKPPYSEMGSDSNGTYLSQVH